MHSINDLQSRIRPTQKITRVMKVVAGGLLALLLFSGTAIAGHGGAHGVPSGATAHNGEQRGGASGIDELAALYTKYFNDGDADKILTLYRLQGVEQPVIDDIKNTTSEYFGKTISDIRFEPVRGKAYSFRASDGLSAMAPSVRPMRLMLVNFKQHVPPKLREPSQMPTRYTLVGRDSTTGRYYLAAYIRPGKKR